MAAQPMGLNKSTIVGAALMDYRLVSAVRNFLTLTLTCPLTISQGWPESYIFTVYLVNSLQEIPYIHHICVWFWPTLLIHAGCADTPSAAFFMPQPWALLAWIRKCAFALQRFTKVGLHARSATASLLLKSYSFTGKKTKSIVVWYPVPKWVFHN
jgi:hypothetical protein